MKYIEIVLGNLFITAAYAFIAVPKGLVNGGTTSFSMVFGRIFDVDVAVLTSAITLLLLGACLVFLGREYFFRALFSGVCYITLFTLFHNLSLELPAPLFVSVPAAGALIGVGYFLCIHARSTAVGFDTIALILNDKNPRINIAFTMFVINAAVLSSGLFTYGFLSVILGIILSGIQAFTLNGLLKCFPIRDIITDAGRS